MFDSVTLFDERPFEHSFFLRLAQSFPSMTSVGRGQSSSTTGETTSTAVRREKERVPVIRYPSLRKLFLNYVHDRLRGTILLCNENVVLQWNVCVHWSKSIETSDAWFHARWNTNELFQSEIIHSLGSSSRPDESCSQTSFVHAKDLFFFSDE